jgi:DNA-binding IclR family transcriptional regulator
MERKALVRTGLQRRSPPTRRVLRILEAFAEEPQVPLSLSVISRRLGLNSSTCLGILCELTERGYLVRDPESRRYILGPELVSLGRAATHARPSLAVCIQEIQRLSETLGCECTAATLVQDQVVVFDRVTPPGASRLLRPGVRYPAWGTAGFLHTIWASDEAIDEWFERCPIELPEERVARAWKVVASCRREGYLVRTLGESDVAIARLLGHGDFENQTPDVSALIAQTVNALADTDIIHTELKKRKVLPVFMITAPAYNADHYPEYLLSATVVRSNMPVADVYAVAASVMQGCAAVTATMGGSAPTDVAGEVDRLWKRTGGGRC